MRSAFRVLPGLYKYAVRAGDWKLLQNWDRSGSGAAPLRLINVSTDPAERRDLSTSEPDRFGALKATYAAWNAQLREPFDGAERTKDKAKAPRPRKAKK